MDFSKRVECSLNKFFEAEENLDPTWMCVFITQASKDWEVAAEQHELLWAATRGDMTDEEQETFLLAEEMGGQMLHARKLWKSYFNK